MLILLETQQVGKIQTLLSNLLVGRSYQHLFSGLSKLCLLEPEKEDYSLQAVTD